MVRLKVVDEVTSGGIESICVSAPLDKAISYFEKKGYNLISLRDNAILRMQEGVNSFVSRNGNFTREGILYDPRKGTFITKISPLIEHAEEAIQEQRGRVEYYLTDEQVEEALENAVQIKQRSSNFIPTNRFGCYSITARVFGDIAKEYGNFLREAGIKEMPCVPYHDKGIMDYARQMWFAPVSSNGRSELGPSPSRMPRVSYKNKIRGVKK